MNLFRLKLIHVDFTILPIPQTLFCVNNAYLLLVRIHNVCVSKYPGVPTIGYDIAVCQLDNKSHICYTCKISFTVFFANGSIFTLFLPLGNYLLYLDQYARWKFEWLANVILSTFFSAVAQWDTEKTRNRMIGLVGINQSFVDMCGFITLYNS